MIRQNQDFLRWTSLNKKIWLVSKPHSCGKSSDSIGSSGNFQRLLSESSSPSFPGFGNVRIAWCCGVFQSWDFTTTEATWFSIEEDAWEAPICVVLKDVGDFEGGSNGQHLLETSSSRFFWNWIYVYDVYIYIYICTFRGGWRCITYFLLKLEGHECHAFCKEPEKTPEAQCFCLHIITFYTLTWSISSFPPCISAIFCAAGHQDDADETMGSFFDLQVSVSVGLQLSCKGCDVWIPRISKVRFVP